MYSRVVAMNVLHVKAVCWELQSVGLNGKLLSHRASLTRGADNIDKQGGSNKI